MPLGIAPFTDYLANYMIYHCVVVFCLYNIMALYNTEHLITCSISKYLITDETTQYLIADLTISLTCTIVRVQFYKVTCQGDGCSVPYLVDNLDSPSVVEQSQKGASFSCIFIYYPLSLALWDILCLKHPA